MILSQPFVLHCTNVTLKYSYQKTYSTDDNILVEKESSIFLTLLSGKSDFKNSINKEIVKTSLSFLLKIKLFNDSLL